MTQLTASNLKNALWDTLNNLREEKVSPDRANAIATQAREILRTVKMQIQIALHPHQYLPQGLVDFVERVEVAAPAAIEANAGEAAK